MWVEFGRSLGEEIEFLFAVLAEAAMPDPLWQPEIPTHTHGSSATDSTPPVQH